MRSLLKVSFHTILICMASIPLFAQNNYSGNWSGTANWGQQKFELTVEITQEKDSIKGEIFIQSVNKKKFAKYPIIGLVTHNVIRVRGTKFIAKNGTWCLPSIELIPTDGLNLVGKWIANSVKSGCWVSGKGRIDLAREWSPNVGVSTIPSRQIDIAIDDKAGLALTTHLENRNYYALLIAEEAYEDKSIVSLDNPISDAERLSKVLEVDYGFESRHITLLKNPNRSTIIEAFDKLTNVISDTDNLLIFYAGHGIWDANIDQGYWLPSNAKKNSRSAWLSNGTIRDYIRAIDSKHTLLVTDACFSGGILKTREAFKESKAILEMYKLPSRKAITSGSLKTVPDKSVFIEYLIKALQNNNQPLISADQLFNSFKYNVINNSANGQVPQYGVITQADDEGGDFIFLKKK